MHRAFLAFFLIAVATRPGFAQAPHRDALVIGVFPYLTTRTLVATYQPLRLHLHKSLGREVSVVTAPDLRQFYARSARGDYDLVVTPPHFARLHQTQSKLRPLLAYDDPTRALLITRRDSGIKTHEDLRGQEIAVAEPTALVAIMTNAWMAQRGLVATHDYEFKFSGSHNSALMYVVNRETAAAVLGGSAFVQVADKFKQDINVLATTGEVMGLVILANPHLADRPRVEKALADFPQTSAGKAFFRVNGIGGFKPITSRDLERIEAYLPETLRWLGNSDSSRQTSVRVRRGE